MQSAKRKPKSKHWFLWIDQFDFNRLSDNLSDCLPGFRIFSSICGCCAFQSFIKQFIKIDDLRITQSKWENQFVYSSCASIDCDARPLTWTASVSFSQHQFVLPMLAIYSIFNQFFFSLRLNHNNNNTNTRSHSISNSSPRNCVSIKISHIKMHLANQSDRHLSAASLTPSGISIYKWVAI